MSVAVAGSAAFACVLHGGRLLGSLPGPLMHQIWTVQAADGYRWD